MLLPAISLVLLLFAPHKPINLGRSTSYAVLTVEQQGDSQLDQHLYMCLYTCQLLQSGCSVSHLSSNQQPTLSTAVSISRLADKKDLFMCTQSCTVQ